ncbi:MAG TPA: hypothetical protein VFK09_00480 [Gemmatimonadales bacterium]|nr:hypothetical protein [Gemmatimonadales bacterium]
MRATPAALAALAGAAILACGAETSAPSDLTITADAGGDQTAPVGATLPMPLTALVRASGSPATGRTVIWTVVSGGGSVSPTSAETGADGRGRTTWTLGAASGAQQVRAALPGGASVVFSALATPAGPAPSLVATVPVPPNYGAHDTYVRDGIAFLCAWNTGLIILDVGGGGRGGSPAAPVELSRIVTSADGVAGGPQVHNAWWFHNPATGERRYVFVGQEGPGVVGTSASGDIHVVDVSDLTKPVEAATLHLDPVDGATAGTHNFWVDEPAQILYAAYYNAGVIAVDVSGTLSGDLAGRVIATVRPGGPGDTFVWGVQLYNGDLYASDMLSGFWQLRLDRAAGRFEVLAGGNNVPDRYGSDLWVSGGYAYTGTWGSIARGDNLGNVLKVWRLASDGAPVLADSVVIPGAGTVSDDEVSADGKYLLATTERGSDASKGLFVYDLADPVHPALVAFANVPGLGGQGGGLHTGTFAVIGGRRYVFTARNPVSAADPPPALLVFDVTAAAP